MSCPFFLSIILEETEQALCEVELKAASDINSGDILCIESCITNLSCEIQVIKCQDNSMLKHYRMRFDKLRKKALFSSQNAKANTSRNTNKELSTTQTQKSFDSIGSLKQSLQSLNNSEEIGQNTINHLAKQKEKQTKVKGNLEEINASLKQSNKILNKLSSFWPF